jgi:hypothetical protein
MREQAETLSRVSVPKYRELYAARYPNHGPLVLSSSTVDWIVDPHLSDELNLAALHKEQEEVYAFVRKTGMNRPVRQSPCFWPFT